MRIDDHLDVVGDRVAIGIQLIGVSRLSTHPVPLVPGCLITVAGQGPKDSNGAGKSSFIAALTLLHGDEQWRLASGARESADLLFSAEIAAQEREYASADHGYVIGVFADRDAADPDALAASALTVWLRISRDTPHVLVRWSDGLHLPTATTEAERERQADALWAALPSRAGRRDYNARDLSRVLFGEHIRCVSFLSTSVRPSATANLLAQPLNELKPDRIFSAVAALTGLDHEIADEQRHRNVEHAELEKAADAERKLVEWEEQAQHLEAAIDRRAQARDREPIARARWRSRAAVLVARAADELEAIEDDLERIAADDAAHRERLAGITDELHVLGDDVALRDRLRRAEEAFAAVDGDHQQLRDRRRALTGSLERLGREADELEATARDADGRDEATAAEERDAAVATRTAAIGARAIAARALADAQTALGTAEAGDDVAAEQLAQLEKAGVPAVALLDAVTLTDDERVVWEPLLWPYRDAAVVDAARLPEATEALAGLPGSVLVPAGLPATDPDVPRSATDLDLTGLLGALRAAGLVTVVGGFAAPVTGRAARIARAQERVTAAAAALAEADARLADAERRLTVAERRVTAARAAVTAASKRQRIRAHRAELEEVAEREDALAPRLTAARHEYDLARLAETGRQQQADALLGNRRRIEDAREALRVERDRLDARRRVVDLDTLLTQWGGTVEAAQDHLAELPDEEQLFDEDDWWRAAESVLAELLALCFRPGDAVPAQVTALAEERATPGRGQADRQKQTFPAMLDAVRDHLTLTAHEDAHQRARLADERVEKSRARDAAALGHEEAAKAAAAVRASLARAITARLTAVGAKFDELDRAYGGYGAGLRFVEPEPPADPTKRWNWEITPVWRRAEGNPMVAYDRRGNTAQMDEKAVKLVCAAALASGTGRPLLLVLDELGRNLGKQHRREAVALFERIGADSGITVVGALQDDMERYAIDACGEYVKLRRTSDAMAYNQAPVIHGFDTRAARVALLADWLSGSYPAELVEADRVDVPEPVDLLQRLIRVDTTNPPGNEVELVSYLDGILRDAGVATTLVESAPGRVNLIARIPGRGVAPPLLMQGHLDVVPVSDHGWTHPPFSGTIADGFVWGRGALDMKSGVVMMLVALLRTLAEGAQPPGDVILALLADEEAGSDRGAKYLVENRPELFEGVKYAIGEFGGFSMEIAGRRFYPIQVAEKQICWMRAVLRAPGGHGSLARPGGVTARLAEVLRRLDRRRLPVHVTPVVRTMIEAIAAELPGPAARAARLLLRPALTPRLLGAAGEIGLTLAPMFSHTATPNIVSATGGSVNVRPTEAQIDLDGRLLPGFGPADLVGELKKHLGDDVELSVVRYDRVEKAPDLGMFDTLASVLREQDPTGTPVPLLMPASTDGRFFAQLGIQTYGFTPMTLPTSMAFSKLVHGVDERIPVGAVEFGTTCVQSLLTRFH